MSVGTVAPALGRQAWAETPRIGIAAGLDVPTAYYFRGIRQEDRGAIPQPYLDVSVRMTPALRLNVGTWNSLHTGPAGGRLSAAWYESDIYTTLTHTGGRWQPALQFTSYTSPNDAYRTIHELAVTLTYDDRDRRVSWSPRLLLATELTSAQADGGSTRGTYLELGAAPAFRLADTPLRISLPMRIGASLHGYYEAGGRDHAIGYGEAGAMASVPVDWLGPGSWDAHGGLTLLIFGAHRRLPGLAATNAVWPVLRLGIGVTF